MTSVHETKPASLLLDTNIWLDYYLGARPGHDLAMRLVGSAVEAGANLLYAISSSKDVYFLMNAGLKRLYREQHGGCLSEEAALAANETAWGCVSHLEELACPVPCDASDVWVAQKQKPLHSDYEDNLIIAAAKRAQADCLVTSDEALRRHAPVTALSTEDAIAYLETIESA